MFTYTVQSLNTFLDCVKVKESVIELILNNKRPISMKLFILTFI